MESRLKFHNVQYLSFCLFLLLSPSFLLFLPISFSIPLFLSRSLSLLLCRSKKAQILQAKRKKFDILRVFSYPSIVLSIHTFRPARLLCKFIRLRASPSISRASKNFRANFMPKLMSAEQPPHFHDLCCFCFSNCFAYGN